jgi:hypothetical protein
MEDSVRITLRLPRDLHDRIKRHADQEARSINRQIVYLLRRATEESLAQAKQQGQRVESETE